MKHPDRDKILRKIAIVLVLIGIITFPFVYSTLTNTWTIQFSGTIAIAPTNCYEITAASGSTQDIQNAVNWAVGNETGYYNAAIVQIPAGTYAFNPTDTTTWIGWKIGVFIPQSAQNLTIVGSGMGVTILKATYVEGASDAFFADKIVYGPQGQNIRFTNMTLEGNVANESYTSNSGIYLTSIKNWRIDKVEFVDFAGSAVLTSDSTGAGEYYNTGVVDHCTFDNPYKMNFTNDNDRQNGYGVNIQGRDTNGYYPDANISQLIGTFDASKYTSQVYVENNTFNRCRHAISSNTGAWYVARFNYINDTIPLNYQGIDIHGPAYGSGGRGSEVYNNIVIGAPWSSPPPTYGGYGDTLRGGVNFVFNNSFINLQAGISLLNDMGAITNPSRYFNFTFIWGNSFTNISNYDIWDQYGFTVERDYFLHAPNSTQNYGDFNGGNYKTLPYPFPFNTYGVPNADFSQGILNSIVLTSVGSTPSPTLSSTSSSSTPTVVYAVPVALTRAGKLNN